MKSLIAAILMFVSLFSFAGITYSINTPTYIGSEKCKAEVNNLYWGDDWGMYFENLGTANTTVQGYLMWLTKYDLNQTTPDFYLRVPTVFLLAGFGVDAISGCQPLDLSLVTHTPVALVNFTGENNFERVFSETNNSLSMLSVEQRAAYMKQAQEFTDFQHVILNLDKNSGYITYFEFAEQGSNDTIWVRTNLVDYLVTTKAPFKVLETKAVN